MYKYIPTTAKDNFKFNPLIAELNPICHLLALLGAHHILHVSRISVKEEEFNVVMKIYLPNICITEI